jgi:NAD-dependent SIR2 family protein deacetylase
MSLVIDSATHLLVLTGAGVSAEAACRRFAMPAACGRATPSRMSPRRRASFAIRCSSGSSTRSVDAAMTGVVPNAAHRALVEIERRLGDGSCSSRRTSMASTPRRAASG